MKINDNPNQGWPMQEATDAGCISSKLNGVQEDGGFGVPFTWNLL